MPRSTRVLVTVRDEHVGPDGLIGPCEVEVTMDADGATPECGDDCLDCGRVFTERDRERLYRRAAERHAERIAE